MNFNEVEVPGVEEPGDHCEGNENQGSQISVLTIHFHELDHSE